MNQRTDSRRAYFDGMYGQKDDPYGMRDRWYEARKRAVLLASLPHARYTNAYEPGCGAGELTAALAGRCDRVLASDFSPRAVDVARERVREHSHVRVERHELPADWPRGEPFDLIVLSELGYFLDGPAMQAVAAQCLASLAPGGVLLACDWLPDFKERALSTAQVHAALASLRLSCLVLHQEADFILQAWSADARSVAQQEGIR